MTARLNIYAGIETVRISPIASDPLSHTRAFTSIQFQADGTEVCFMLYPEQLVGFANRLRDMADAVESGCKVEINKGYPSASEGGWHIDAALVIDGRTFAPGYTVGAALHEIELTA